MSLSDRFAALEPRERRLLLIFLGVTAVVFLLLIPVGVSSLLSEQVETNAALKQALADVRSQSGQVIQRRQQREALLQRYEAPIPALAGFLDKAAGQSDLEIPELKDGSPIVRAKKYEERTTTISMRRVGLVSLVKFMEKVSGEEQPVSISKLNIRKRGNKPDTYDVNMTVSAYDRLGSEPAGDAP